MSRIVIPIIAKGDTLTADEVTLLKKQVLLLIDIGGFRKARCQNLSNISLFGQGLIAFRQRKQSSIYRDWK